MAKAKSRKAAKAQPRTQVYVGPNIPGSYIRRGQVYAQGLPRPVQELIATYPELRLLIVDTAKYQQSLTETKNPASRIGIAYRNLINKITRS